MFPFSSALSARSPTLNPRRRRSPAWTAALVAVRAWRWNILLAAQGIPFSQWRACVAYASGIFIGTFTPGRLGDLSKALYVRQERDIS